MTAAKGPSRGEAKLPKTRLSRSFPLCAHPNPESIRIMRTWPRSKRPQEAISFTIALLSGIFVLADIAMKSVNHFYFAPHKAYPYPYPTVTAARIATFRDCGLTFVAVFLTFYLAQRFFFGTRHLKSDGRAEQP
jgi:hypothetical protein